MNIFRLIYLSALFGVLFLHSCGGSGGDGPDDPQKPDLPPVVDFLDPSLTSVVMGHLQDASAVVIRTNKPWSASSDADWLKLSASSGSGSTTIIVGASENKSFRRKSVVKIKAGSITRELVVVQKPAPHISLNIRGVSFTLLPVEADTVFRIEGNMYYETRNVYLSSYYISETEITCAQWAAVTGNLSGYNHYSMPYYPVLTNWNTIVNVFIPQINRLVGYDFRLPTEAE